MKRKDLDRLPVYAIEIDDNDFETGVNLISIVENPAIQVNAICLHSHIELEDEYEEVSLADFSEYDPTPPCHVNCRCSIVNGEWQILPDACEACFELKAEWEEKRDARRKGQNTIRRIRRRTQSEQTPSHMTFSKNEDKMILAGPFLIPDTKIYRNDDGEYYITFSGDTIRRIHSKFQRTKGNKTINIDHTEDMAPAYVLSSWIVESDNHDKSRMYGFDSQSVPKGSWFGEIQITDRKFWNEIVKEGNRQAFSIEGILGQKLVDMNENVELTLEEIIESLTDEEVIDILKAIEK